MQNYLYAKEFEIKYCDSDFKDEIKLSSVLSYMEEVACASADGLNFGYSYIKPRGLAFIISGIRCEFFKPMKLGDVVDFGTWPLPPTYATFGREYEMRDPTDKTLLCAATSRWCLIDMKEGKIVSSKAIDNQDFSSYRTDRALQWDQWKIPLFSVEGEKPSFSLKIANSEYDHNMHVNNTRYADYCQNCFSVAELSVLKLQSFQIAYLRQCREGDELRFFRKETAENEFTVLGVNQANEAVVVSRFLFTDRGEI